jgi:hypothetical protein
MRVFTAREKENCERKEFYATQSEADMAAMHTPAFEDARAAGYKCRVCPGYHVGH